MSIKIYENLTGYNQYSEKININREKIYEKGLSKGYYIPKSRFLKYIDD